MCLRGCNTLVPPACSTNSAGEKVNPWQVQTMLTSAFVYLRRNPLTVLPFRPFPVVETRGILRRGSKGLGGFLAPPLGEADLWSAHSPSGFRGGPWVSKPASSFGLDGSVDLVGLVESAFSSRRFFGSSVSSADFD